MRVHIHRHIDLRIAQQLLYDFRMDAKAQTSRFDDSSVSLIPLPRKYMGGSHFLSKMLGGSCVLNMDNHIEPVAEGSRN
jgi:hypothetical protein